MAKKDTDRRQSEIEIEQQKEDYRALLDALKKNPPPKRDKAVELRERELRKRARWAAKLATRQEGK